ncbi:HNH endonuclease [Streptomyces sp. NPDC046374]|uniref:HNH endonuclease n=1 Tax=Streptomyces sp. NPDC046374 TaxID=3154917 RepID=UPI0033FA46D4
MRERELVRRVRKLAPAKRGDGQKLHRPLLLLWAVGRAAEGQPRQQPWAAIRDALMPLLTEYADATDGPLSALYPFWALQKNELWEVEGSDALVLTSGGRRPSLATLNEANPLAGLPEADYALLAQDTELAARIAGSLLMRFFPDDMAAVTHAAGLSRLLAGGIDLALRPLVGEEYPDRTSIAQVYGGNGVGGITPIEDGILSVFSDDKGPYNDSRIPGMDWIAYTGDGLNGDQQLVGGNKSMSSYQAEQRALRYWHKPHGGVFTFESWVVVVQCRKRWGVGENGERRQEFVWVLAPVHSPLRETWPKEVQDALAAGDLTIHEDLDLEGELTIDVVGSPDARTPMDEYRRLTEAARRTEATRITRSKLTTVERFLRSAAARNAVILRSRGLCENLDCLGHPLERTDKGAPLLEVDHVNDISKGGGDSPETMVALCPNCHALKTRGSGRKELRRQLLKRARALHQAFSEGIEL